MSDVYETIPIHGPHELDSVHRHIACLLAVALAFIPIADMGRASADPPAQKLGPAPRDVDLAALERDLLARAPWLMRLSDGERITRMFALRMAWERAAELAAEKRDALPDPARTYVSDEIARRKRARQPWQDRVVQAKKTARKHPRRFRVDLRQLLSDDFLSAPNEPLKVARAALARAIGESRGEVRLESTGLGWVVYVYIDGAGLAMHGGRLHPDVFLHDPRFADFQILYYQTAAQHGRAMMGDMIANEPWLMRAYFRDIIARQRREANAHALEELARQSGDDQELAELRAERLRYARDVRNAAASAMVPLTLVASVFAIEGAGDVFLTVFPFGKAAELLRGWRAARKGKKAERALRDLARALDERHTNFLRAARHLSSRQMRALVGIGKKVQRAEVVTALMVRVRKGDVDLLWLHEKLEKGRFDAAFVEHFMRFDAYPSWRALRQVLDNRITRDARKSFMSKLTGFLGEEGAASYAASAAFARRHGLSQSVAVERGEEALDLMMHDKPNKVLLFAEVKNWGAAWHIPKERERLFTQLAGHDTKIDNIVLKRSDGTKPRVEKLLMVSEAGFEAFKGKERKRFDIAMAKLDWKVEVIPESEIEGVAAFIDRMR